MNYYFLKYFQFNKFLLQFCGALPLKTWGSFANSVPIGLLFIAAGFISLPATYSIIFRDDIGVEESLNIFSEFFQIFLAACKVMLLIPKRKKVSHLVNLCNNLWEKVKDEEDVNAIKKYPLRAKFFIYGFSINIVFALISILLKPAFSKFLFDANGTMISRKELPYSTGLFDENVKIFYVCYILQIFSATIAVVPIAGIDTSVAFFVLHACAHFKLLQFRILKLKQQGKDNLKKNIIFKDVVKIVEHHQDILKYSEILEEVFSPVVLLQIIVSIMAVCGYGFNLLMRKEETVKYGVHLFGSIVQLLIFCWPPDNLQYESINVAMSAYDLPWYEWTKKERKLVEIIIFRSQRVAFLSASKFSRMSLQVFSSILSSAFSFFTLLKRIV